MSLILVANALAEDKTVNDVKGNTVMMQPLQVQIDIGTLAVDALRKPRVIGTGAVEANLNCVTWPDFCYLSENKRTLFFHEGSAKEDKKNKVEFELPGPARIALVGDFIPGECEEIVIVTDGIKTAEKNEKKVIWFRRSGSGIAQIDLTDEQENRVGSLLAGAAADLDLLVVDTRKTLDLVIVEKANKESAAQAVVYRWTAPGSLVKSSTPVMSEDDEPTSIDPADIDDDKDLDLVVKTASSSRYSFLQLRQTFVNAIIPSANFTLLPSEPVEVPE